MTKCREMLEMLESLVEDRFIASPSFHGPFADKWLDDKLNIIVRLDGKIYSKLGNQAEWEKILKAFKAIDNKPMEVAVKLAKKFGMKTDKRVEDW